ncbi:N-acetylmuramoyl-L-alanine amidase [Desulforamulus profundi]|uniref:N-acetylmuramoyl-L-alanine amidase n=1 Tax=Desulforamulus profundi TaxID=1383067 RepID=A0A2C6M8G1_9FIRM|nr:N-acetylmuramoyl-L-alanine amidase [Desulforamulus profundi]
MKKKLIKYNFSTGNEPKYIVVHDTGNPGKGADADAHYRYFNGGNRNASAHYFVDDHSIIQTVEDINASWHCGDGKGQYGITNYNSIGIEICINSDGDYNKAVQNAIELVKFLMKKHNIPLDKVVRHYDASRKNCPGTMSSNNWEKWNWFKGQLKEEAAPASGLYRVRKSWDDAKSQVGAYKVLENAKAECDKNPGYSVFDEKGNKVYPLPSSAPEQPGETQPEQQLTLIMGKTEATAAQMASYA